MTALLNAFTTGHPFWGTNLLEVSLGRGFGALKGVALYFGPNVSGRLSELLEWRKPYRL